MIMEKLMLKMIIMMNMLIIIVMIAVTMMTITIRFDLALQGQGVMKFANGSVYRCNFIH